MKIKQNKRDEDTENDIKSVRIGKGRKEQKRKNRRRTLNKKEK